MWMQDDSFVLSGLLLVLPCMWVLSVSSISSIGLRSQIVWCCTSCKPVAHVLGGIIVFNFIVLPIVLTNTMIYFCLFFSFVNPGNFTIKSLQMKVLMILQPKLVERSKIELGLCSTWKCGTQRRRRCSVIESSWRPMFAVRYFTIPYTTTQ